MTRGPGPGRYAFTMRAMVLERVGEPLSLRDRPEPTPGPGELRLRIRACGVCRTDLHLVDGELATAVPRIPGHQIVGAVEALGPGASRFALGQRVGVPWLAWTCGSCRFCAGGRENLCEAARFTGWTVDGGFAERAVVDERFAFALPDRYGDAEVAPLLCAGLIGLRTLRMCGEAGRIGLYGFGAAAHLVAQIARHEGREVYAFTRPGDEAAQDLARSLGAAWAGGSDEAPPTRLDAACIFAPLGALVPAALAVLDRGGTVVCGGIHMSDVPSFPYALLWNERSVRSVANLTRADGEELFALAERTPLIAQVQRYPLADAGRALDDLRDGRVHGAAVLEP
jgi:alcohol dehydrogenase, propanol-preferring